MTTSAAEARAERQLDAIARGLARADPDLAVRLTDPAADRCRRRTRLAGRALAGAGTAAALGGVLGGSPTALAAGAVALALCGLPLHGAAAMRRGAPGERC